MVEVFDYFMDFLFLIGMGFSFFTGFYDIRGDEVMDLKDIRTKYFSRWFWIDLVAVFPFEILIIASGKNLNISVFNLFKAPRLLRLGKLAKKLDQLAGANAFPRRCRPPPPRAPREPRPPELPLPVPPPSP